MFIEEPHMEKTNVKGGVSLVTERNISPLSKRLSRRANTDGGTHKLEVIARGRGTKNLGTVQHLTENGKLQSEYKVESYGVSTTFYNI